METKKVNSYVAPIFLSKKLKDLNDRFYLILNNIVDAYPEDKLQPKIGSNNANMAQMLELQNDFFIYKNEILKNSEILSNHTTEIDAKINILDTENTLLKSKMSELINSGNSAEGLLDDAQLSRNQISFGNMLLLILIGGGSFYIYKTKMISSKI